MNIIDLIKSAKSILEKQGVLSLIKFGIRFVDLRTGLFSILLMLLFKHISKNLYAVKDALNLVFSDSLIGILIRPLQIRYEIEQLLTLLAPRKPQTIVEIGTSAGGTLFLWTFIASNDAIIVSIDLPGGAFGGGYAYLRRFLYKCFARGSQKIHLIRGDSHDRQVLNEVKNILSGRPIDFLFIDGDHTYEGVKRTLRCIVH